jgi:hypothetical protein
MLGLAGSDQAQLAHQDRILGGVAGCRALGLRRRFGIEQRSED